LRRWFDAPRGGFAYARHRLDWNDIVPKAPFAAPDPDVLLDYELLVAHDPVADERVALVRRERADVAQEVLHGLVREAHDEIAVPVGKERYGERDAADFTAAELDRIRDCPPGIDGEERPQLNISLQSRQLGHKLNFAGKRI
jgi:hypothetical protein